MEGLPPCMPRSQVQHAKLETKANNESETQIQKEKKKVVRKAQVFAGTFENRCNRKQENALPFPQNGLRKGGRAGKRMWIIANAGRDSYLGWLDSYVLLVEPDIEGSSFG